TTPVSPDVSARQTPRTDTGAASGSQRPRHSRQQSTIWRRTTLRRALVEAVLIFAAGRLLAMVPVEVWPAAIYPLVQVVRLTLLILPPVWAALRVISTRREKMSRRFWLLGPRLAAYCALVDALIALVLGEATVWGGAAGKPDLLPFTAHGAAGLSPLSFLVGEGVTLLLLATYFTIAVVCTRLANGGFLRFTMPAGGGRVTL